MQLLAHVAQRERRHLHLRHVPSSSTVRLNRPFEPPEDDEIRGQPPTRLRSPWRACGPRPIMGALSMGPYTLPCSRGSALYARTVVLAWGRELRHGGHG